MEEQKDRKQLDDENVTFETNEEIKVFPTFNQMGLKEEIIRGIYCYGFDKPSAVQ